VVFRADWLVAPEYALSSSELATAHHKEIPMRRSRLGPPGLALLLFAAACSEGDLPTGAFHAGDANHAISDGAHNGTQGFYFLAPIVKAPSFGGTFDPSLAPVVLICETTACNAFHVTFTMTEGAGSETVRLDEENEHYVVNWHTDQTGTAAGQTYRIRVSVASTVLGYADIQMAGGGKEAKNITTDEVIGLVDGRTLPIKFRIEGGAVFVVGSDGGTFTSDDGAVTIEVPAGALENDIGITVTPIADNLNPEVVPGTGFEFGPSPYSFSQPVTLTIVYDPANLPPGSTESSLRILKLVDGEWVAVVGGSVDVTNARASAPIDGFSSYGVGEEGDPEAEYCEGVVCQDGYACYGGTCFLECTEEDAANPQSPCYDPCAGVACLDGYACYEGTCFVECTEEDTTDPDNFLCFTGCPDGGILDPETGQCLYDACDGVTCAEGYFCSGGACFQGCTEEDTTDPDNFLCFTGCPDGGILDPETGQCLYDACDGVTCAEGYFCYGGACFQGCTEEDTTDPENFLCFTGCPDGEILDPETGQCISEACAGVTCKEGEACYGGTCFLECTEEDAANPESPCYEGPDPGDLSWHTMEGFASTVFALTIHAGNPIAGGTGGSVGQWDGSAWQYIGGLNDVVYSLTVYNGELIAGGRFTTAGGQPVNGIARWDGSAWHPMGAGFLLESGVAAALFVLSVHDGDLIAGGAFDTADGQAANNIARWDGSAWQPMEGGMNGRVTGLTIHDGDLIAGGWFSSAGGRAASRVARWNGSEWQRVGTMSWSRVHDVTVYNGDIIAAGDLGQQEVNNIARWDGSEWQPLGAGVDAAVWTLAVHNRDLIAGGDFTSADGQSANRVARWNGSEWQALGEGIGDGRVSAIAVDNGDLIAGGSFTTAGGQPANRVARWRTP
jgi:hypothetical protein